MIRKWVKTTLQILMAVLPFCMGLSSTESCEAGQSMGMTAVPQSVCSSENTDVCLCSGPQADGSRTLNFFQDETEGVWKVPLFVESNWDSNIGCSWKVKGHNPSVKLIEVKIPDYDALFVWEVTDDMTGPMMERPLPAIYDTIASMSGSGTPPGTTLSGSTGVEVKFIAQSSSETVEELTTTFAESGIDWPVATWEAGGPGPRGVRSMLMIEITTEMRGCTPCPSNTYRSADSGPDCTACPQNTTSLPGATTCQCMPGYSGIDGGACTICDAGFFSARGETGSTCNRCLGQQDTLHAGSTSSSDCKCAKGHAIAVVDRYQPNRCLPCDYNFFKDEVGDTECARCSYPSMSSGLGASICSCAPGYGGTQGEVPCTACLKDEYKYGLDMEDCIACPYGAGTPAIANTWWGFCKCLPGFTGTAPMASNANMATCRQTPANTWKSSYGHASSYNCPSGTSSPPSSVAHTACKCVVGHTATTDGVACTACPHGSYKGSTGSGECSSCPAGSTSPMGSVHVLNCTCAVGYTITDGETCTACPVGSFKNSSGAGQCLPCPPGKTSGLGSGFCGCAKGYTGTSDGLECTICGVSRYKDYIGDEPCSVCPVHTRSNAGSFDVTNCTCEIGFVSPGDGGECVDMCAPGQSMGLTAYPESQCVNGFTSLCQCSTEEHVEFSLDETGSSWRKTINFGANWDNLISCTFKFMGHNPTLSIVSVDIPEYDGLVIWEMPNGLDQPPEIQNTIASISGSGTTPGTMFTGSQAVQVNFIANSQSKSLEELTNMYADYGLDWPQATWAENTYPPGARNQMSIELKTDARMCMPCPKDTYKSNISGSNCLTCPEFSGSPSGATTCRCMAGYGDIDGGLCAICDAGSFSSGGGPCLLCPAGKISDMGSRFCSCEKGQSETADGMGCTICSESTYKDWIGDEPCSECPARTRSNVGSIDVTNCTCEFGSFATEDGVACISCPQGSYKGWFGTGLCSICPSGTSSPLQSDTSDNCTCLAGYQGMSNGAPCTACGAGSYKSSTGTGECSICPSGTSSPLQSDTPDNCTCLAGYHGMSNGAPCTACGAGSYKSSTGPGECVPCTAGTYCNTGSEIYLTCPTGASSAPMSVSLHNCTCLAGYEATSNGVSCTACVVGTYKSATGAGMCVPCTAGTYSNMTGAEMCLTCPTGTDSPPGSDTILDCTCLTGYSGTSNGAACTACIAGTYKPASDGTCVSCPMGTYGDTIAATSCAVCSAGTFSANVGAQSVETCRNCSTGSFGNGVGVSACTTCGTGKYSDTTGSTSCSLCPKGTSSGFNGGASFCPPCAASTYSNSIGRASCLRCSKGKYSTTTGNTDFSSCIDIPVPAVPEAVNGTDPIEATVTFNVTIQMTLAEFLAEMRAQYIDALERAVNITGAKVQIISVTEQELGGGRRLLATTLVVQTSVTIPAEEVADVMATTNSENVGRSLANTNITMDSVSASTVQFNYITVGATASTAPIDTPATTSGPTVPEPTVPEPTVPEPTVVLMKAKVLTVTPVSTDFSMVTIVIICGSSIAAAIIGYICYCFVNRTKITKLAQLNSNASNVFPPTRLHVSMRSSESMSPTTLQTTEFMEYLHGTMTPSTKYTRI
jgi:hypothetical protein